MSVELLLAVLGLSGAGGLGTLWWRRHALRTHVVRVRTEWVRAGEIVRYGPVAATCLGTQPRKVYRRGVSGAVGIRGDALVFEGRRGGVCDVYHELPTIQHVSLVTVPAGGRLSRARAVAVHTDGPDGWRVTTLVVLDPVELALALGTACDLPVHDAGNDRDDFGPDTALRMTQTIYGEWIADREGALYLAPDRLLFDGRHAIPLDAIDRLDVQTRTGLAAPGRALLRVAYTEPDGTPAVVGFLTRRARQWADRIARRAATPLPVHEGRKKKKRD